MLLVISSLFKTTVNGTSEHEFAVPDCPTGSDLTVTVYVNASPEQPFAPIGVTV